MGARAPGAGSNRRAGRWQVLGCAGKSRQGARRVGGRAGVRQSAAEARGARGLGAWRAACALGARPVRTGWASWVLVHPAWFLTWFFDSVFFLSHQMNTVHCKINFEKKYFKFN